MEKDRYGNYGAKPGAEFWYDNFWKPRMLSAWSYELVRRLPRLKLKQPKLSAEDSVVLQSLRPYPQLTSTQKKILSAALASQFKPDVPALMLGNSAEWQQGQIFKLGDWRQIEALDRPAVPDNESRKLACKYIRRYWPLIRAAWLNMQVGGVYSEPRPQHELSYCTLTNERLATLLPAIQRPSFIPTVLPVATPS